MNQLALTRARRGAAYLDRKLGRAWRRTIRRSRLDMASSTYRVVRPGPGLHFGRCGCIMAQLDAHTPERKGIGSYADGVEKLAGFDPTGSTAVRLGFFSTTAEYAELTEAWKTVLREPVSS